MGYGNVDQHTKMRDKEGSFVQVKGETVVAGNQAVQRMCYNMLELGCPLKHSLCLAVFNKYLLTLENGMCK